MFCLNVRLLHRDGLIEPPERLPKTLLGFLGRNGFLGKAGPPSWPEWLALAVTLVFAGTIALVVELGWVG